MLSTISLRSSYGQVVSRYEKSGIVILDISFNNRLSVQKLLTACYRGHSRRSIGIRPTVSRSPLILAYIRFLEYMCVC